MSALRAVPSVPNLYSRLMARGKTHKAALTACARKREFTSSRDQVLSQGPLAFAILLGMAGGYAIVFFISHYLFRRDLMTASLQTLAIAGPTVPFIGVSVLGHLFGNASAIPISVASLVMNLIQVPATLLLLSAVWPKRTRHRPQSSPPSVRISFMHCPSRWYGLRCLRWCLYSSREMAEMTFANALKRSCAVIRVKRLRSFNEPLRLLGIVLLWLVIACHGTKNSPVISCGEEQCPARLTPLN